MLRGAIIGIGGMGRNHLACYNPVKDAKIIALCDINIEGFNLYDERKYGKITLSFFALNGEDYE